MAPRPPSPRLAHSQEAVSLQVGWARPGNRRLCYQIQLPSCSSSHLPSSTHPAGPVVGILPDFFQLSPRERQGQMLGTHWTRPTGQHWFLGGDGTPQLSSCHTLDTARIEGDEGDKEGQPSTMVLSPGFLLHPPPLTHWTWG